MATTNRTCNWPGTGSFAAGYGKQALQYLRDRTREDPWWATASIVMHAGRVSYNSQQPVVEEIVPAGPGAVDNLASAIDLHSQARSKIGRGLQDWARIAAALPVAAACHRSFCQQGECVGKHGKLTPKGHSLIECMRSAEYKFSDAEIEAAKRAPAFNPNYKTLFDSMADQKIITQKGAHWVRKGTGIGAKSRNLMAEYIGCDDAVAVDTHVANWVSAAGRLAWVQPVVILRTDKRGRAIPGRNKDGSIKRNKAGKIVQARETQLLKTRWAKDPVAIEGLKKDGYNVETHMPARVFALFKREFQGMAAGCGVSPAVLQVGAWAQGTCNAVSTEGRRYGAAVENAIYLGKGKYDSCANVPRFQSSDLSSQGVRFRELAAKPPAEEFACKSGYFGGAANGSRTTRSTASLPPIVERIAPPSGEIWQVKRVGKPFAVRQLPTGVAAPAHTRKRQRTARRELV